MVTGSAFTLLVHHCWFPFFTPSVETAAVVYLSTSQPLCFHQKQLPYHQPSAPGCRTVLPTIEKSGPAGGTDFPVVEASASERVLCCLPASQLQGHHMCVGSPSLSDGGGLLPWRVENLPPHTGLQRGAIQKQPSRVSPRAGKVPEETTSAVQKIKSELQFSEILLSAAWDGKQHESHWDVLVHLCPSDSVLLSTLPFVFPTQQAAVDF